MKKTKLLNSEISYVVSKMGHFDTLAIGDAGLPIPEGVQRIDLAVTFGVPSFRETLYTVLEELCIQTAVIAVEMRTKNPELYQELTTYFKAQGIPIREIPHDLLKQETGQCKAVIRTGECMPYANVILESGVAF